MSKHRQPFANSEAYYEERNKEPEQVLWISVLTLAMNDAFRSNDWSAAICLLPDGEVLIFFVLRQMVKFLLFGGVRFEFFPA